MFNMAFVLDKRQSTNSGGDSVESNNNAWNWYSPTAEAIKWAVLAVIFLVFFGWFLGGYLHAQRRMKKGLPLLAYHRWLVPRTQRARYLQPQNQFSFYQVQNDNGEAYGMHPYAPPAYNTYHVPPPTYQPPVGSSKVDHDQDYARPPPGPPPNAASSSVLPGRIGSPDETHSSSTSTPFR